MYLRQLDIAGFRGIKRLSIQFKPNMVLIGENAWGKSSLLSALSLILNGGEALYQFTSQDFHISEQETQDITLLFCFSEQYPNERKAKHHHLYRTLFVANEDNLHRLYLRVSGEKQGDKIITRYSFLNELGELVKSAQNEQIAQHLAKYYPVYRFRDARLNQQKIACLPVLWGGDKALQKEFFALAQLFQYYFLDKQHLDRHDVDPNLLWEQLNSLCFRLRQAEQDDKPNDVQKQLLIFLRSLFFNEQNSDKLKAIQPIILLEDLGSRLHPRMSSITWELLQYLPIQRITTTNSVELLSQVELPSICRLVRYSDKTQAYRLSRREMSKEDLRRLSFHVRHNRSLALFSKMWLLVEGETEVWILSELAKLLDINLAAEGIRIVEFAQSGLKPLIKYAKAMGIEWYVLTDGDEAGRKYADIVRSLVDENDMLNNRLTSLPRRDIEHFFYTEGFEKVFLKLAHWQDVSPARQNRPMSKIIQRAIQRTSKPDLAIALSNEIAQQGAQSIPLLFKRLFSKVLNLSRTQ
ncbi:ATP-dependent endonuclease [Pasteurellaceae bacterium Pebbles2]|nr:ATP-dependent endonuclease [Pasteurellaceae bacterium Pebbles2]